jgi:hypothetical protein
MSVRSINFRGRAVATDAFKIQTEAVGTDYAQLPLAVAHEFRLNNDTTTDLEIRRVGGTETEILPDDSSAEFKCITNLNEWEVRRADTDNAQVTAKGSYVELS